MAAEGHRVQVACRVLGVSESGVYERRKRPPSQRSIRHAMLTDMIRLVHTESNGIYGARRAHAELTLGWGISVGHNQVALPMNRAGIKGVTGRREWKRLHNPDVAVDLVDRNFARSSPNMLWVTDIERHEALSNLAVVKGHRLPFVAADGQKLRAV